MSTIIDEPQRLQALDITESFIVQAPAGSGKTELLTQRYLALLAQANAPEEIIAITFTRKAANEMRLRILHALQDANSAEAPTESAKLRRWQLAKTALQQNGKQQWNLLENPNRLRVQTIDSLCASITQQMPILSRFGAQPRIADDAWQLYRQTAETVLTGLEQQQSWSNVLYDLLAHLDNNHERILELFCTMLAQRDQWLPHIFQQTNTRELLEKGLQTAIKETLIQLFENLPTTLLTEINELFIFANCQLGKAENYLTDLNDINDLENALLTWRAIANLLLTQDDTWRKQVDKRNGFSTEQKAMKQRMEALLEELTIYENARECFIDLRKLPSLQYSDIQWQIIEALCTLLPILAAQLQLTFQAHNTVDFTEITQSALHALGDNENPTDLALILDHRIQHLLVDEFQDTSVTQIRLLEKLTAGWQPHDGRTLFLVGDPMQSIYRFRKAEVGLFLQARDYGIGAIRPKFLNLQVNFRSTANIVNWINEMFTNVLPVQENISRGAITFNPSVAHNNRNANNTIHTHWLVDANNDDEAKQVVTIIKKELKINPQHTIAVLVRARAHLNQISYLFKQYNIPYRAIEIEKLDSKPVIQDLLAITRALLHLGDRIAWLAILRAPWCGLSLTELHQITQNVNETDKTIWHCLQSYQNLSFSSDTQQRLNRVVALLEQSLNQRGRKPLHVWIKSAWLALGGPTCFSSENEIKDVKLFFEVLLQMQTTNQLFDIGQFESKLQKRYVDNNDTDAKVEVMTMHKAKGLEFDTVILLGLGRKPAQDDAKLLLMMERPTSANTTDLLLAPIKASEEKFDPIYQYLAYEEKKKFEYETMRLLYVAATRAKKSLHLIGLVKSQKKVIKPMSDTLLGYLWPALTNPDLITDFANNFIETTNLLPQILKRLPSNWQLPITITVNKPSQNNADINLDWNNDPARHIGTVIHQLLCKMSYQTVKHSDKKIIKYLLMQNGITKNQLEHCVAIVEQALTQTLNSERGHWILNQTQDAHSECALMMNTDGKVEKIIIDRTFVDENNIRWIIDYKTTDNYLDVDLYREQLETYAKAMSLLDDRKICLGLYFPLLNEWKEWEFTG